MASEPLFENRTRSADGTCSRIFSASWISSSLEPAPIDVDLGGRLHRDFADAIVGVPEDDRAEAGMEVDVLAAVGIPDAAAPGAREDARRVEEARLDDTPPGMTRCARSDSSTERAVSNVIDGDRLPAGCTLSTIYERRPSPVKGRRPRVAD